MRNRVLIIVENGSVPLDDRVWKEALALRSNGYDVTVLCPKDKWYERWYEVIDAVRIYRHWMPRAGRGAMSYVWEYACALVWQVALASWIYFRHGFDVIQGCNPPDDIIVVALVFKLLGVRYIFDQHDLAPELYVVKYGRKDLLYTALLWLEKMTYRFSTVVIATNDSYRDIAITRGRCDPANVFVVRNGPDLQRLMPVPPNPALKHGKAFLIGYVGNMGFQDGLDILIDVACHIKDIGRRDIHFTCIGSGPELPALKQVVKEKHIGEMFTFTGRVSDQELLEILSTADVCVNPDRPCEMNDKSTMIKIMEYMALGKPIVQFDMKEGRVSAGDSSLYATKDNQVADFASKLIWLLRHPDERKRMGRLGRERIEKGLAWEYSVPNLLAAYRRCFESDRLLKVAGASQTSARMRNL